MTNIVSIEKAITQGADIDTVERLMIIRREIDQDEARKFFQADFARLQSVLPAVHKSGRANFKAKAGNKVSYGYTKVDDLTEALKPYLMQYGFSFTFKQKELQDRIAVQCIVMHIAGHRESSEMTAKPDTSGNKSPMQALSSTISYLKRITFVSAFGISTTENTVPKAPIQQHAYSSVAFTTHFPHWRLLIQQGKKTPARILAFLKAKGVRLTKEQEQSLIECALESV